MNTDIKLLTPEELASILQLPEKTVKRYFREGRLPGFKVGANWRIKEDEFRIWMTRNERSTIHITQT